MDRKINRKKHTLPNQNETHRRTTENHTALPTTHTEGDTSMNDSCLYELSETTMSPKISALLLVILITSVVVFVGLFIKNINNVKIEVHQDELAYTAKLTHVDYGDLFTCNHYFFDNGYIEAGLCFKSEIRIGAEYNVYYYPPMCIGDGKYAELKGGAR